MGFIQLAKAKSRLFFLTQLIANLVHVALVWAGVQCYGIAGAGMAFFGLYVFYTALMLVVTRRLSGFRWSAANIKLGLAATLWVAAAFMLPYFASRRVALVGGLAMALACGIYCLMRLYSLVGREWFDDFFGKLQQRVGWKRG